MITLNGKEIVRCLLKHDHAVYDREDVGNQYIIRTGSFTRGTSHLYNLERDVYVDRIKFVDNNGKLSMQFIRDKMDIKPAQEVFSSVVFDKTKDDNILQDLSDRVDNLLEKMDETTVSENTVYKVIDSMKLDPKIKSRIELYLGNNGILRKQL